jgi:large subunit ribosomal protein L25
MATETITLDLTPRDVMGKKVKQLRRQGIIPVHLYGPGVESRSLQCESSKLIDVLARAGGNTPVTVTVQGDEGNQLAFAREIQWGPRRDDILHVDFLVAEASRVISAQVPIVLVGQSPGAISVGGSVVQQLRELAVQALPLEVPRELELDLAGLTEPDGVFRAADVPLPDNVTLLADPDELVVRIELPRAAEEEVVAGAVAEDAEVATEEEQQ